MLSAMRTKLRLRGLAAKWYSTSHDKPFEKILVANRGEIACRVMGTARAMGIKSVAVYSEADADSKHRKMADESVLIGPAKSADSYLRMHAIIEAVKMTGAEAVHPGYGFLSENAAFVKALENENITFIGPGAKAIEAMGDKITSKQVARDANVNTIPGQLAVINSNEDVVRISQEIGYPVMIKATAGGGGKGMRVAWNDDEAIRGYHLSQEEARASFGDDRIFIEKFVDQPRHIEIQLIGDAHGNCLWLPERECSIQRRNQKVVEEAPSTFIDPDTRKAMGEQAVALAKAVDYKSAGTVEFLVDSQKNFYFLEMNTRLQVEHPVTEYITQLDLVEQMLRVAAGQKLQMTQDDIGIHGWAIESRVYAEDPYRNFLPSIGFLQKYREPRGAGVRVDSGIVEGQEISIHYDPMICKLVTHGPDRKTAIERQKVALDSYVIHGVRHNIPFIRDVYEAPRFINGDTTTNYIPEEYPDGFHGHKLSEGGKTDLVAVSCVLRLLEIARNHSLALHEVPDIVERTFFVDIDTEDTPATIKQLTENSWEVTRQDTGAQLVLTSNWKFGDSVFMADVYDPVQPDKTRRKFAVQPVKKLPLGFKLQHHGTHFDVKIKTERQHELSAHMIEPEVPDMSKYVLAPMPGSIVSVAVTEGDEVEVGQECAVVEAMKMQNVLTAEVKGKVKKVLVSPGESVAIDAVLIEFE